MGSLRPWPSFIRSGSPLMTVVIIGWRASMSAYMIIDLDIHDQAAFEGYQKSVPAVIAKHGGRYLVRGGQLEVLEGDWQPHRLVILQFPDRAAIRAFLAETEAQSLAQLRWQSAKTTIVAVDGVA